MADVNTLSANARALWTQVQETLGNIGYSTTLTSAGRSASHNATIPGASSTSQHIGGNAFDFQVFGADGSRADPVAVQATLASAGLRYGQSIAEYGRGMNPRNHLSVVTNNHAGETLLTTGGAYRPNSPGAGLAEAGRKSARDFLDTAERSILRGMGISDATADVLTDPNAGVVETAGALIGVNQWVLRGSIAIVAILLLGAAIFTLGKGAAPAVLKAALK